MIKPKYKKVYDEFIRRYEEIHLDPWHEISKEKLNDIYNDLINRMDITDEYSLKYFMDYIIKRLNGLTDAHTRFETFKLMPINFRIFDNSVLVNYPNDLRGFEIISINKIPISKVINEIDEILTYGTPGKRKYELEKALFNKYIILSIPSLRGYEKLDYELKDNNGNIITKSFLKDERYDGMFGYYDEYLFGNNASYKFKDNCLIYTHSSVQNMFKEKIESSIKKLRNMDLSNINTLIIDIRGNWGGNASLNKILMDFIKEHRDKKLICLTDYRVFSGGRYALRDLISLGATTIGEEISTPINCFGNDNKFDIDNHNFSVSEHYYNPFMGVVATTKKEYTSLSEEIKKPVIFKPDILVESKKEDYINGIDTILEYALKFSKNKMKEIKK